MISEQNQKLYPFGQNEERFRWQNTTLHNHISTGEDVNLFRIKRIRKNDNLDGGIGTFYMKNEQYKDKAINSKKNRINSLDTKNISLALNSQRVIHPYLNNEVERRKSNQKRIWASSERFIHSTDGGITSLMEKTPLTTEIKGKKRFNTSFDNRLISTINNPNSMQNEKRTGIRLFLNRTPFLTIESPKSFGRKHFLNKMHNSKFTIY